MNYNVRLFNLYKWLPDDAIQNHIERFIKTNSPDIFSVQEYHVAPEMDWTSFEYRFEHITGEKTKSGLAIFSKFPIINSGSIEFPNTSNNAIFIDVVKQTDTIRVYNIHLESLRINTDVESLKREDSEKLLKRIGSTFKRQQIQTELFLEHQKQCPYKMILCGDFNNTAFSYVYRKIKGDLNDAFEESGSGFGRTYHSKFFPLRIDFIFADKAFEVNGFKTFDVRYSDHYPIMTTLRMKK